MDSPPSTARAARACDRCTNLVCLLAPHDSSVFTLSLARKHNVAGKSLVPDAFGSACNARETGPYGTEAGLGGTHPAAR